MFHDENPKGVHLGHCTEHNKMCSKEGALIMLRALRGDNALMDPVDRNRQH